MKKLRAIIAIKTLDFLKINKWDSISIERIYKRSKITKIKFFNLIKNKSDLLKNINIHFDNQLLSTSDSIDKSSCKDMIFEVLMLRFDLLNQHRRSILKIFDMFKKRPNEFILLLPSFIDSIKLMSNIAKINYKGLSGSLKINGLTILYFSTFLVWMKDNSESLDKTMTALDNNLNRAENIIKMTKI